MTFSAPLIIGHPTPILPLKFSNTLFRNNNFENSRHFREVLKQFQHLKFSDTLNNGGLLCKSFEKKAALWADV